MRTFTDNAGRTWDIIINVASIKRVRGVLGIDLYALIDDGCKPLGELVADPVRLADVLYCLCKEEAEKKGVSDEDFGRSLYGDAILRAADAFLEELIDFFPDPRTRASLRKLIAAGKKIAARLLDHAETVLDRLDPEVEAKQLIASFGSSLGSSELTPGPSPFGNS